MKAGTQLGWLGRGSSLALSFSCSKMYPNAWAGPEDTEGISQPLGPLWASVSLSRRLSVGEVSSRNWTPWAAMSRGLEEGGRGGGRGHFKRSGLEQGREGG